MGSNAGGCSWRVVFECRQTVDHKGRSLWGMVLEDRLHVGFMCSRRSITASWGEAFLFPDNPFEGTGMGGGGSHRRFPGDRSYVWETPHTRGGTRRLNRFASSGGGTPCVV